MHFPSLTLTLLSTLSITSASPLLLRRNINDVCAVQPAGSGPAPGKSTPAAFQKFGTFSTLCTSAATPSGYQRTFHNQLAATQGAGYMGLYGLTSYDTAGCGALCSGSAGCVGFNVYYER